MDLRRDEAPVWGAKQAVRTARISTIEPATIVGGGLVVWEGPLLWGTFIMLYACVPNGWRDGFLRLCAYVMHHRKASPATVAGSSARVSVIPRY